MDAESQTGATADLAVALSTHIGCSRGDRIAPVSSTLSRNSHRRAVQGANACCPSVS